MNHPYGLHLQGTKLTLAHEVFSLYLKAGEETIIELGGVAKFIRATLDDEEEKAETLAALRKKIDDIKAELKDTREILAALKFMKDTQATLAEEGE